MPASWREYLTHYERNGSKIMCGIFSVTSLTGESINIDALKQASISIRHRGPDDDGYLLIDNNANNVISTKETELDSFKRGKFSTGFAFRRLSILDLSPRGHQPMSDPGKNVFVIFNGEIYNYIELREELKSEGCSFHTGSDTEVIIASYLNWGKECFSRFNGMWGIIIYDKRTDEITWSRDRFGVKPLYYYYDKNKPDIFIAGSELKSIIKYLQLTGKANFSINHRVVHDYLIYSFIDHTEETFLEDVYTLKPSHYVTLKPGNKLDFKKYFSIDPNLDVTSYSSKQFKKYCLTYNEILEDSIRIRLRTDVSIGSCLSGGLDSSSIVSIVNKLIQNDGSINRDVIGNYQKTFSAVYKEDPECDESRYIKEVVKYTNCDAHYINPDQETLIKDIDKFLYHLDEPVVSTSMFAQWNVMKLARQNGVTVLLDGQGSDETVAGYEVYYTFLYVNLLKQGRFIQAGSEIAQNISKASAMIARGANYYITNRVPGLQSKDDTIVYMNPSFMEKYKGRNVLNFRTKGSLQTRLYEDVFHYMLPMLLRYEDRNSMAYSIESRTPFLDYRLVKFLMELPANYKIHNGWTKWILRNSLKGRVPESILWRRDKKGFPTPEIKWLGKLKEEILKTIVNQKEFLDNFVHSGKVINEFDAILKNENIKSNFIWKIYNLAKWKEIFSL